MSIDGPTIASVDTRNSLWHLGGLLRIRARHTDTNGALAIIEEIAHRGYRTPPRIHSREDQMVYVIDGELSYQRGEMKGSAGPGGVIFLPRGIVHHFEVVSESARFLLILTPGGFESFFTQVSGPALADRVPSEADGDAADPQTMAAVASQFGVTIVSRPAPSNEEAANTAARILTEAGPVSVRVEAYHRLALLFSTKTTLPIEAVRILISSFSGDRRPEPRAAMLLGIATEHIAHEESDHRYTEMRRDLVGALPEYVRCMRLATAERSHLAAFYYLLAHFPEQGSHILKEIGRPEPHDRDDHARLVRCLYQPDFAAPETLSQIGRVWPSPAAWDLSGVELEADAQWRAAAGLTPAIAQSLWEAETIALLAFMGAKADAGFEDGQDA
jgi:quercetin dioxygenase-like cupin family protein